MGAFARVIGLGRVYAKKLDAEVEAVARMAATGSAGEGGVTDVTAAERALHGAERRVGRGRWED